MRYVTTILSPFYEYDSFLPFWPISTSANHFHPFEPYLRVQPIFNLLSYFKECDSSLPFWAIFIILGHFYMYECDTILPLKPYRTPKSDKFSVLIHFYDCDTLLPFWAIFTSATHFAFLRGRPIFTSVS